MYFTPAQKKQRSERVPDKDSWKAFCAGQVIEPRIAAAANDGDWPLVWAMLKEHTVALDLDIDSFLFGRKTLLMIAAKKGAVEAILELRKRKADPNVFRRQAHGKIFTALGYAVRGNHVGAVEALLSFPGINAGAGPSPCVSPLAVSMTPRVHERIARMLVDALPPVPDPTDGSVWGQGLEHGLLDRLDYVGAKFGFEGLCTLRGAYSLGGECHECVFGQRSTEWFLARTGARNAILCYRVAIKNLQVDIIDYLVDNKVKGAPHECIGGTLSAMYSGVCYVRRRPGQGLSEEEPCGRGVRILRKLLESGADPNGWCCFGEKHPLHKAVELGFVGAVTALLETKGPVRLRFDHEGHEGYSLSAAMRTLDRVKHPPEVRAAIETQLRDYVLLTGF
jgi:hypothetical protein